MQFPTLTGQSAKSTGAEAQLLPFVRCKSVKSETLMRQAGASALRGVLDGDQPWRPHLFLSLSLL